MNKNTAELVAPQPSRRKVLLATFLALFVAIMILALFILPAEFNKDPLGVGKVLGISGLSKPPPASIGTVRKEKGAYYQDSVSFQLLPFEFVEYKYQLSGGGSMLYQWTASNTRSGGDSPVSFDFHGESHETEGYEESYSLGEGDHENGAFTAPFNGIHGWFWVNQGSESVTVKLTTAGFYTESLEFRDGFVKKEMVSDR